MTTPAIIAGAIRRQKILNVLLEHGPLTVAELAKLTGTTHRQCGADLNTAKVRSEVGYDAGKTRNTGKWFAIARIATFADPKQYASKAREYALRRMQDKVNEKTVPGLRVIRLLDKPARQVGSGGQCAGRSYSTLQCNFSEKGLHL